MRSCAHGMQRTIGFRRVPKGFAVKSVALATPVSHRLLLVTRHVFVVGPRRSKSVFFGGGGGGMVACQPTAS